MGVINMAHGEFLMIGAYTAYVTQQVVTNIDLSILVALPVAFVVAGLMGLLLEVCVISFMYRRPLDTLLVTVGVSLVLQQLAKDLFGAQGDPVRVPDWLVGTIPVFGYNWPYRQIFTIVLALASLGALAALLKYTSFGRRTATWPRRWASRPGRRTGSPSSSARAWPASAAWPSR
jgi:urea transport system permease protein